MACISTKTDKRTNAHVSKEMLMADSVVMTNRTLRPVRSFICLDLKAIKLVVQ